MRSVWSTLHRISPAIPIVGLVGSVALTVGVAGTGQETTTALIATTGEVAHTQQVIAAAEQLLASANEAESRRRGYALTAEQDERIAFDRVAAAIPPEVAALRDLVADNPEQQQRLDAAERAIAEHLDDLREAVNARRAGFDADRERAATLEGSSDVAEIRAHIGAVIQEENRLLAVRTGAAAESALATRRTAGLGTALAIGLLAAAFTMLARENRRRRASERRFERVLAAAPDAMIVSDPAGLIAQANEMALKLFGYDEGELLGRPVELLMPSRARAEHAARRLEYAAEEPAHGIGAAPQTLVAMRKDGTEFPVELSLSPLHAKEGVLAIAAIRDVSVARAAEVHLRHAKEEAEAANRELESFSYSVAHDLRVPLRAIDANAVALSEDFGDALSAEGKEHLVRIRGGARRMAQIIDDLLGLSRVSRASVYRDHVDVTALATEILGQLAQADAARDVTVAVAPGLEAVADARLLRIALENLLGNAWKFTSKTPKARIEVGAGKTASGEPFFFVKDNGAGFDMEYAGKLFGIFQRLHRASEFEGTGVGLATVQRIVTRHGGRIWAEGAVGHGATFSFTLGSNE